MMRLCAAWRNTSVRRIIGRAPDVMTSDSTCPGPTEGSWSMSPTDQQRSAVRHRLQQRLHQHDVDHRGLVDNQQVAVERVVVAPLEAATFRIDLQQPVDGLGFKAGCFAHALGGAAGRRAEQEPYPLGGQYAQNSFDDSGLADAG